jgi:hypothetical protein
MRHRILSLVFLLTLTLGSCSKDIAEEDNDSEVITTLELHFMERSTTNHLVYSFDDPDGFGAGSVAPVIDLIRLAPGKTYDVTVKLLNKTTNPIEDITTEVEEEAGDHRFYFLPLPGSEINVSNFSNDASGVPVGITTTWTTGAKASGKIRIVLRHYPNGGKTADDPVDSPKSGTDVDTEFSTVIE